MKESIRIKNFGPIKKIEIDDIKPFTVLIGESEFGNNAKLEKQNTHDTYFEISDANISPVLSSDLQSYTFDETD